MSEFKIGDKVTPISVDRYTQYDRQIMKNLIGRTMIVSAIRVDENQREVIHAGIPGDLDRRWCPEDLMMVPKIQRERAVRNFESPPEQKWKKPLKCGHLVEYKGRIWIILSEADVFGEYEIASIVDGSSLIDSAPESKLTRVGSIRKKLKHLEAALEIKNG